MGGENQLQKLLFDVHKHRTAYVNHHMHTINKVNQEPIAAKLHSCFKTILNYQVARLCLKKTIAGGVD